VFVAEDTSLRRRIVVKVLPPETTGEISVARFQREIAVVARLQHPHIVPLISAGETNGLPFFTMPFVDGESLRARLTRGGEFPVTEAVRLLREMASALAYAHDQNVVHRDIKPENVLLTGGIALITDFGVSKALAAATMDGSEELTSVGVALGTPAYMAPEQATADPTTDHRADLYALGVVAYEMLAGQPPFAGRTTQAVLAAHLTETPVPLGTRRPAVPPALASLVMRCLEKRAADRPQSAGEIVQALDGIVTSTDTRAAEPRTASTRVVRAGVAALALVVVAFGAWLAIDRRAQPAAVASKRVLVAPFENLTGDARFDNVGRMAADRLAQGIAQVGSIDVVPSNIVLMTLRDTTGGQAERLQRLAGVTHAGLLVSGSVVRRLDSLVFQAQVSDVRTGKVVVALAPVTGPVVDPIAAVDALGDRLLGAIASREMSMMQQAMRAPKYAAYQAFAAGFERFSLRGDNVGSIPYFERAIAIDSSYGRAYALLARQHLNLRDYARAESVIRQAGRLRDVLTLDERLQLEFQQSELDGDLARGFELQRQIAARDSNAVALALYAEAALSLLQPRLAIPALARSESAYVLMGGSAALAHTLRLAESYHLAGQYDAELRLLDRRRPFFPAAAALTARVLHGYAGAKRSSAAVALADTMLRGADSTGITARGIVVGAQEFRVHGDPSTATRLLGLARTWYSAQSVRPVFARAFWEGTARLMSGMPDSAAARFAALAGDTTFLSAAGSMGLAEAARGNRARARAIADSLGALKRRWLFGTNTFWRAAILGALGERDLAVQLLRQTNREGQRMESWHYTAALDSLRGFPAFEALIRPRS
jgi:serine/threonine-protein kinase